MRQGRRAGAPAASLTIGLCDGGEPVRGRLVEVVGAVPNRTKVKRRKARDLWVSRLPAVKPNIRLAGARTGDGVGTKFRVLTRGELSASAAEAQAVVT
jgi:hypothetical protein